MRKPIKALILSVCMLLSICAFVACGNDVPAEKTAIEAPVIASKVYNGEKQTATVAENEGYTVTENEGGVNVGEYSVVLTLTDASKYEWTSPDADDATKLTLKFEITKAQNAITSLTLENWYVGATANVPAATATFGTVKFGYSADENGTYTETVPTAAGVYFVKAIVEATENYEGAQKTLRFEILKPAATVVMEPTAVPECYATGSEQIIVANGDVEGGKFVFAMFEGEIEATKEQLDSVTWSEELPKATAAGKYTVYYMVKGDENHSDGEIAKLVAEIKKKENNITVVSFDNIKYGAKPFYTLYADHGEAVLTYSLIQDGEYVSWEAVQKTVGVYYVKITVAEDDLYLGAEEKATFTVEKAENEITELTVNTISCGETPAPTATVLFGADKVVYKYAADESGEYVESLTFKANDDGSAKTYYVKAFVPETEFYTAAESSMPAILTVFHNYVWTSGETEDVKKCGCGKQGETFNKVLTDTNAQRVVLNVNNDGTLNKYESAVLSLAGIDYASVIGVKLGEKDISLNAEEEVGEKQIAVMAADFGYAYGNQTLTVIVKGADEAAHEIKVNALLVTKIITNKEELDSFGIIAKECETAADAWGGYFELGANVDYKNNYWNVIMPVKKGEDNVDAYAKLKAMKGFIGTFDGAGYTVNALRIANDRVNKLTEIGGFISKIGEGGVLKNISFTNACVGHDRGFLTYINNGTIENVYISLAVFGDDSWNGYSARHNFGGTAVITARGGKGSIVKNVIIDATDTIGVSKNVGGVAGYIAGCYVEESNYSDIYVLVNTDSYANVLRKYTVDENDKEVFEKLENGVYHKVYKTAVDMAADKNDYSSFVSPFWTVKGGIPYCNAITVTAPEFTTAPAEIVKGTSAEFKASANAILSLDENAISAGISLENGVVTVPAGIESATYTLTATSIYDASLKAVCSFGVINARTTETLTSTQDILLEVNDDAMVNSSKTVEIDLTEKFGGNAAVSLVKVGDEAVSDLANVQIASGKVTLNVAPFGIKYWGEKQLKFVFEADNTEYELTVPVLFVTKTISGGDKSLRSIQIISDMIEGGGYFRFGGNVELQWAWYNASEDHRIGVNVPFAGVIDGCGYAIDKFVMVYNEKEAAFVYTLGGGTIKNLAFTNIKLGAVASIVNQGNGFIENVFVKVAIMPSSAAGNYSVNFRGNETTIFGDRRRNSDLTVKNVLVDYTDTTENIKAYKDKPYVKVFGTFADATKVTNAVAIGLPTELTGKITDCASVYIGYTGGTDNGVAFPAENWNEEYWTVGENTVSWKTK